MQPAVIKIKFTPIIRRLDKDNTRCCLEIVPDISCIQHLDTLQWNNQNKLIEYSVPVTYKIILKRDIDNDAIKEQERIYYSCIDLHLLSSNPAWAYGDITKVISDNYILRKITADFKPISAVSKRSPNDTVKDICLQENKSDHITEELNKININSLSTKEGNGKDITRNGISTLPDPQNVNFIQVNADHTASKETTTDISDVRNNEEKKRKLIITSVCTLSTTDNLTSDTDYDKVKKNRSKIYLRYKSKNKIDYKINKVTESFAIHRSFYSIDNHWGINNESYTGRERILPELRVAHLMMTVENEILPLKNLLTEIYSKCASLGLLQKSNVLPESVPKFGSKYTDKIKILNYNESKPKYNRVVYSIVFEE